MTHHNEEGFFMEEVGGGGAAKSVIFDFADNHGSIVLLGVRSIEFAVGVSVITMNDTLSTAYATTEGNPTVLKASLAFDTSLSKTGSFVSTTWTAVQNTVTNQRLIIVFNDPTEFDSIIVNNFHAAGTLTDRGVQNTKIHTSTDAITDTTYNAAIANSTLIYDSTFNEHAASDVADPQTLTLI